MLVQNGSQSANAVLAGLHKAASEATEFNRTGLDAITRSAQVWGAGLQDLGRRYVTELESAGVHALETAKSLAAVGSLKEAADIQASYARTAIEQAVSKATELQEAAFKLAHQASAPLMQASEKILARPLAV